MITFFETREEKEKGSLPFFRNTHPRAYLRNWATSKTKLQARAKRNRPEPKFGAKRNLASSEVLKYLLAILG